MARRKAIISFFIIVALICATSFVKALNTFGWTRVGDLVLAVVTVVFISLNWQLCKGAFTWNNFSLRRLVVYCLLAIIASCCIHFIASWLNEHVYSERVSHYVRFSKYKYAIFLFIFFSAVMPALFEELAFRVYLIGKLLAVTEKNQAAIISGFMFAIMHMSFISLFWLIPFGIFLGYVRIKQNTMWYGTCIHFCFNLTACVIDIMHFR